MTRIDTETRLAVDRVQDICARDPGGRGIAAMADHVRGSLFAAADSIARHPRPHVAIMTGFWILHGKPPSPENDGPPGAAHIAAALHAAGIPSRLVTDTLSAYALRAAAAGAGLAADYPVDVISLTGRGGEHGRSIRDVRADWMASAPPVSHVVAIERCGPRYDGRTINARGFDISAVNAPLHELFDDGPWTRIGIGDGGNELGMGSLPRNVVEPFIGKGREVACVVPCDHLVVCGVSNWGGYALPAALALLRPDLRTALLGRLNRDDDLAILKAAVLDGGAVQGRTGTHVLSVDGLSWEEHAALLDEILSVLRETETSDGARELAAP